MSTLQSKAQVAALASRLGGERLLLDLVETMALTGMGRKTIFEFMERGVFPRPRKVGARLAKWYRPELTAWIEALPTAEYLLTQKGQVPRDPLTTGWGRKAAAKAARVAA